MDAEKSIGKKHKGIESVEAWLDAAANGDIAGAKRFLGDGLLVDSASEDGETALMRAAMFGQLEMIDFLIESGCDVDAADALGSTALKDAAAWGKSDCMRRLLAEDCKLEGCRDSGASALNYAVIGATNDADSSGARECMALLLAAGADVNAVDPMGRTAIVLADIYGVAWAKEVLLSEVQRRELNDTVGAAAGTLRRLRV